MDIETRAIWPVDLEYRQTGRTLSGRFPYGSTATIASSGRVRKETFRPRAFEYAVNDPGREVNLLSGHTYGQPVASKRAGSLKLKDGDDALEFTATLPAEAEQPSWIRDLVLSVQAGLMRGLSPGFTVASEVSRS